MAPADLVVMTKESGHRGRRRRWPRPACMGLPAQGRTVAPATSSSTRTSPSRAPARMIPLMMAAPQFLIGRGDHVLRDRLQPRSSTFAVRSSTSTVACCAPSKRRMPGHLGKNIHGSGFDLDVTVHAGAGAYICGEETAPRQPRRPRGQPRSKLPFPAVAGLYARPTVVNNVESIASVLPILLHRCRLVQAHGEPRTRPASASSVSRVTSKNPASTKPRWAITMREPPRPRWRHASPRAPDQFWTPVDRPRRSSPTSTSMPLEFGAVAKAGSMLGTRALQVFDSSVCRARRRPVDRLPQARVLWQVHPVPRGHLVAQADPRPARDGQGSEADLPTSSSTSATTSSAAVVLRLG